MNLLSVVRVWRACTKKLAGGHALGRALVKVLTMAAPRVIAGIVMDRMLNMSA